MDRSPGVLERGLTEDKAKHLEALPMAPGRQYEVPYGGGSKASLLMSQKTQDASSRRSMLPRRRIVGVCLVVLAFLLVPAQIFDRAPPIIGHKVCNWLGVCDYNRWSWPQDPLRDVIDAVTEPEDLSQDPRVMHEIPRYVIDYAPLVHLFSGEQFWPCDIAEHLFHVTPELNYTPVQGRLQYSNLTNLDQLNSFEHGRHVYLTSNDNVEDRPEWLGGEKNIPDEFDYDGGDDEDDEDDTKIESLTKIRKRHGGGRSNAPAVLVTVDKGKGIVDAFWFFFYSYNLGNKVFNIRWGNHVGDWEHTLVRFQHGEPKLLFFSEHNFGEAYSYGAVEKIGQRPVVYSATGSHAMYGTPGLHPYVLPLGILHDETDRGPLWDPALNSHTYTYNHLTDTLRPSNITPQAPTQWFYFAGKWGDKAYPADDDRQYGLDGLYHYVSGPLGPRFKHLSRRKVCQGSYVEPCVIKHWLDPNEVKVLPGLDEGEGPEDPYLRPPPRRDE